MRLAEFLPSGRHEICWSLIIDSPALPTQAMSLRETALCCGVWENLGLEKSMLSFSIHGHLARARCTPTVRTGLETKILCHVSCAGHRDVIGTVLHGVVESRIRSGGWRSVRDPCAANLPVSVHVSETSYDQSSQLQ